MELIIQVFLLILRLILTGYSRLLRRTNGYSPKYIPSRKLLTICQFRHLSQTTLLELLELQLQVRSAVQVQGMQAAL